MSVLTKDCPRCGGNVHSESFIGHTGNTNAYITRTCIGDNGTEGRDGAFWVNNGTGCGFRAKKRWDSENPDETTTTNDGWDEWKAAYPDE